MSQVVTIKAIMIICIRIDNNFSIDIYQPNEENKTIYQRYYIQA